ncbi:hypothetical protein LSM04_000413 [Trypanosoma melophagium]|uniref:uncharacterized protein n=1 Tax=Trypanosoma melophagium TaxID=715481 RepID=UPI00351A1342|nr:hypothetical protein LSM04_000413 [Trypanosoma melophagium]
MLPHPPYQQQQQYYQHQKQQQQRHYYYRQYQQQHNGGLDESRWSNANAPPAAFIGNKTRRDTNTLYRNAGPQRTESPSLLSTSAPMVLPKPPLQQQQHPQQYIRPNMNGHNTSIGVAVGNNTNIKMPQISKHVGPYQQHEQTVNALNRTHHPGTQQSRMTHSLNNTSDTSIPNVYTNNTHNNRNNYRHNRSPLSSGPNGVNTPGPAHSNVSPVTGRPRVARGPQPNSVEPIRHKANGYRPAGNHVRYRLPHDPRRERWVEQLAYTRPVASPTPEALKGIEAVRRRISLDRGNNPKGNNEGKLLRCDTIRPGGFVERFKNLFR